MSFKKSIKGFGAGAWHKVKSAFRYLDNHSWLFCIILGLVLNFTTECLHRHSIWQGILHIVHSPLPFLFNVLIIATTMVFFTLFKRKYFFWAFLFALFLGFGIANSVLLSLRVTPLEWADMQIVKISLLQRYLNTFEIILIIGSISLAIIGLIILFIKCPKAKVDYIKNSIVTGIMTIVLVSSLLIFRSTGILLAEHTKNLANAYKDYGFYYCFLCSVFDLGIDEPELYTQEDLDKITSALNEATKNNQALKNNADKVQNNGEAPNIIFLQLETFFDVNHLSKVQFSENPIPYFTELHKNYSSGYIGVPSIGAGTANTEFEVISGMSLEHFGMGEYPYKTVLQTQPGESICYNLKPQGYTNHAIHNNTGTFYDRNLVFSNLGFDTYTSLEYMQDVEYNSIGWAKDNVLLGSIADCLDSTKGSDFIYTISVQTHGKYPSNYLDELPIDAIGFSEDEDTAKEFRYYINQLREVDAVLEQLLTELSARDERTVVVMFGDHLPSFEISNEDLDSGDLFQTEYVIWDNFGLTKQDENVMAYQLTAKVMELLGNDSGMLTKLHQNFTESSNYFDWLRTLEYDMLYGQKYAFGGVEKYPYKTTDLKMGVKEISISDVSCDENGILTVTGDNFTSFSQIVLNKKPIETALLDNNTLKTAQPIEIIAGDLLAVVQTTEGGADLSSSKLYLIGGTQEKPTVTVDEDNIIYKPKGFKLSTAIAIIVVGIAVISVMITITVSIVKRRKPSFFGNDIKK